MAPVFGVNFEGFFFVFFRYLAQIFYFILFFGYLSFFSPPILMALFNQSASHFHSLNVDAIFAPISGRLLNANFRSISR